MTAIAADAVKSHWATPADNHEIIAIDKSLFGEPLTKEDLEGLYQDNTSTGRCYEIKMVRDYHEWNMLVGYILFHVRVGSYYLNRIGVHHEYQRQGIGRMMLKDLARRTKQRKRLRCYTFTTELDLDTLNFFKACGWKAVRLIRGGGHACEDAIEQEFRP